MLKASEKYDCVISVYNSIKFPYGDENKTRLVKNSDGTIRSLELGAAKENCFYLRNPYIISKQVIDAIRKDNFSKTFSYYLYNHYEKGGLLGTVNATMPPEFDTEKEFERTKTFLASIYTLRLKLPYVLHFISSLSHRKIRKTRLL